VRTAGLLLTIVAVLTLVASPAGAGPFLDWSRPSVARVGDVVRVQAGAGVRMYALLPLFLVPQAEAPGVHGCKLRNGHDALCPATSLGPPRGAAYHRIATLNVRHANTVRVVFHVPRLSPGRYVYVLYCGPCTRGPRGSVISFGRKAPVLTVVR
jgi:hypothetical protein